ncbi:MAG: Tetratricopeptide repeat protein [Myxococcales bacterium]|nr:Tetratricopeptide repeat protein [Myxococcales bacterium]
MPRNASEIDRLIEEGLTRYGAGDVDGALSVWEQVLLTDPGNAQANSYVDYVRNNYNVLTGDPSADEGTAEYGFGDEPEYQIEITSGNLAPGQAAPLYMDPKDQGWFLDAEPNAVPSDVSGALTLELEPAYKDEPAAVELDAGEPPGALELEADEPPGSVELEADEPGELEDATNAYARGGAVPDLDFGESTTSEFDGRNADLTPGFGPEATPVGFNTQVTDVKKPNLGFVQARKPESPELKVTLRTPQEQPKVPPRPAATTKPFGDLIDTLPSPRPAGPTTRDLPDERRPPAVSGAADTQRGSPKAPQVGSADTLRPGAQARPPGSADTLRPGPQTRPPAPPLGAADTLRPTAEPRPPGSRPTRPPEIIETTRKKAPSVPVPAQSTTRPPEEPPPVRASDIARAPTRKSVPPAAEDPTIGVAPTREFSGAPTRELPSEALPADNGGEPLPLLNVPTRDLGLRPPGRAQSPTIEEEEPTRQSNVRQLRDHGQAETKSDLGVVAFDPIDARSAQILQEVDAEGPPDETKEDRTKRRIASLIDRALAWNGISDYDKAVAAVDLALSEDPNSALAQKMIHRNRDTIMTVFQNYIGDLQRTPVLAKPLHELGNAPINPRAAFLLSRVDGTLSIDELLDVSGMPRLEAYRYLCQLFLRGILR